MTTSEALLPSSEQLTDDFARAYSAAVRTDAPMRPFTHVVESLRDATRRATSAFRLSDVYDSALLEVVGEATEPVLAALRRDFRTRMLRRAEEFVAEASDRWFDVFGAALGEYDLPLCTALIPLGRTVGVDPARLDALDAAVSAARDDWWVDLVEPVGWLLDVGPLSTPVRARLMALASLVQLRSLENQAAAFLLAEEAHRLDAQSVQTVTALAMAHLGRGERTEAEALLSAYLEAHPDEASAHAAFSDCAVADDPATAEVRALDSLDRLPYRSALVYKVFELSCTPALFATSQPRLPLLLAQVCAVDPDYAYRARTLVAEAHVGAGQLDQARSILEQAIADRPDRAEAYVTLAGFCVVDDANEERWQEAIRNLLLALDARPRYAVAASWLAYAHSGAGDLERAVEWSRREVEWTPGNKGLAYANLALHEDAAAGRPDDAGASWASCVHAFEAAPDDFRVFNTLDELLARRWAAGHEGDVRAVLETVAAARGEGFAADHRSMLAHIATMAGDGEAALAECDLAIAAAPDDAQLLRNRAEALRLLQRWDDAFDSAAQAFEIDHDDDARATDLARTHNERGNAAYSERRYADALRDYEDAAALSPDDPVLHGNVASALEAGAEPGGVARALATAIDALRVADSLEPGGDYAARLTQLESRHARVVRFGELIETPTTIEPIILELAPDLVRMVDPDQDGADVFTEVIPAMHDRLRSRTGFGFPGLRVRPASLPDGHFRLRLFGAMRSMGKVIGDRHCVTLTQEALVGLGVPVDAVVEDPPSSDARPRSWVAPAVLDALDPARLAEHERRTPRDVLFDQVADELLRNANAFFTLDVAIEWMDAATADDWAVPAVSTVPTADNAILVIARVLRALVQHGIRLGPDVLEAVRDLVEAQPDANPLERAAAAAEAVRASLGDPEDASAVPLPVWADEALGSQTRLDAFDENRLLHDVGDDVGGDGVLRVSTLHRDRRAYLGRLLSGRFGTEGAGVRVFTASVADVADAPTPRAVETEGIAQR